MDCADGVAQISAGIESINDIIADFDGAFKATFGQ